jgi:hypothetical protein
MLPTIVGFGGWSMPRTAASTSSTEISSSPPRISRRCTRFLSSRMLPGQP